MVKRKYLICVAIVSFLIMMFTGLLITKFAYRSSNVAYGAINLVSGISSIIGIFILVVGIFLYFKKGKKIVLNIAGPLFCLISIICWIIYAVGDGYADMNFMAGFFLNIGLCALYFMGLFLIKEKSEPYNLLGLIVLFGYVIVTLFFFLQYETLWFFTGAVLAALLGYFLYLIGHKFRISLHIFIGAGALFLFLCNWFIGIIIIIVAALYYILTFTSFGKQLFDSSNHQQQATKSEKRKLTENEFDKLTELYKLHELNILTDEEYQEQKDKILGDK